MKEENMTIEQIENDFWKEPPSDSSNLVKACYKIRKKKIRDISLGEARLLINQNIGLEVLIPKAITELKKDIFLETDYYPGDLLKSVLTVDRAYWFKEPDLKKELIELFLLNESNFKSLELPEDTEQELREAYDDFIG